MNFLRNCSHLFSVLFFLFLVLNICSYLGLQFSKGEIPPISRYGLDKLVLAHPGYDKNGVKELLQETWTEQVVYSSYVQFKEPQKSGKYVNISSHGFRLNNPAKEHPIPLDNKFINIIIFGGSTTFGYGVQDDDTIPAYLETLLHEKNKMVRVYNYGRAFYFSTQERILFEKLILDGLQPNIIIFIDGLNEFYHPKGEPTYSGFLTGAMDNSFYSAQKKFFRELPVVNFARLCRVKFTKSNKQKLDSVLSNMQPQENVISQIINTYVSNSLMIQDIAKRNQIKSFFVWQPVPEYAMNLASHPFYMSGDVQVEENRRSGYLKAKQVLIKNIPDLIWAADITNTCNENFVDKVHYSAKFNNEIAKFIATAIKL